ncbi:MAG: DNA primase [Deltaproteobacteria bacterium]|jgi:DNA primase|nr:DNA primase [Deltaproteobacteria bacterium]
MRNKVSNLNSVTRAIKDRLDIAELVGRHVPLRPVGSGRLMGPCPFHEETKPSFSVRPDTGLFYCFGCQASGDIFDFYAKYNRVDFNEALRQLALETGVPLEPGRSDAGITEEQRRREIALKLHEFAGAYFRGNLSGQGGESCRDYLAWRGVDENIAESFALGWSHDSWHNLGNAFLQAGYSKEQGVDSGLLVKNDKGNVYDRFRARLMFPIKNPGGQIIAFGGRIISTASDADTAKYINSSESPIYRKGDNLYGLFQARRAVAEKKSILLTEGYMDVLTLHQFGYRNACGVLGTSLTPEQIKRLGNFRVPLELLFDGDKAGRKAALRSAEMIISRGLNCRVILLPDGGPKDIDELLKTQGVKAFEDLRAKAPDGFNFCMRALRDFSQNEIAEWVRNFLRQLERREFLPRYISEIARALGMDEEIIRKDMLMAGGTAGKARESNKVQFAGGLGGLRAEEEKEWKFLVFAVRYPCYIPNLRDSGLDFVLKAPRTKELWGKISDLHARTPEPDDFVEGLLCLEEEDKQFCLTCRNVYMPPSDPEKEGFECEQLCSEIEREIQWQNLGSQERSLAGLQGKAEDEIFGAFMENLRIFKESRNSFGKKAEKKI